MNLTKPLLIHVWSNSIFIMKISKSFLSVFLSVVLSFSLGATGANASTTISTDITTGGALTVNGSATLGDDVADIITVNGYLTQARIGTGSTFAHIGTVGADELGVEGASEFDGIAWFDGQLQASSTALVGGLLTAYGGLTSGSNIVSDTDSTDSLGSTAVRWASTFSDAFTGNTITLDGATGVNELRLVTNLADAFSIEDTAGDLIVIDTSTGAQRVTITPATTITGLLTLSNRVTVPAGYGLDVASAGILNLGTTTANRIYIGNISATTTILGNITIGAEKTIDVESEGALYIGTSTANAITIGKSGITTTFPGDLTVSGTFSPAQTAATSFVVGGGYGSSGSTLSDAGNISANGNLIVDGTSLLTGLTTMVQASSTRFSVSDTAYFGGNATSTFNSEGALVMQNGETISNAVDGIITIGGIASIANASTTYFSSSNNLMVNGRATTSSTGVVGPGWYQTAGPTCDASNEGGMIWSKTTKTICVCDGVSAWVAATSTEGAACSL